MNDAPRPTSDIEADLRAKAWTQRHDDLDLVAIEAADRLAELDGENKRLWRRLDSALHVNHGTP